MPLYAFKRYSASLRSALQTGAAPPCPPAVGGICFPIPEPSPLVGKQSRPAGAEYGWSGLSSDRGRLLRSRKTNPSHRLLPQRRRVPEGRPSLVPPKPTPVSPRGRRRPCPAEARRAKAERPPGRPLRDEARTVGPAERRVWGVKTGDAVRREDDFASGRANHGPRFRSGFITIVNGFALHPFAGNTDIPINVNRATRTYWRSSCCPPERRFQLARICSARMSPVRW